MKNYTKRLSLVVIITTLAVVIFVINSQITSALGLKIAPLKYEEKIELGSKKVGFVDISNPNDFTITVSGEVQGFRQIDTDGNLEFYENERLSDAVSINVDKFDLGPREAARIFFSIDSNKLPEGGVYGALLFETGNQAADPSSTSLETSSRVGTLLIIENGEGGVKNGRINSTEAAFWQIGSSIKANVSYTVSGQSDKAVGFNPDFSVRVFPWGNVEEPETGLVLPGSTREFKVEQRGSYIGLIPLIVTDNITGHSSTVWVVAVTGIWRVMLPSLVLAFIASYSLLVIFRGRAKRQSLR